MPIVETTIKVRIPEGGELLGKVCQMLEEEGRAALRRRRQAQQVKIRPLDVLTRFGWLRLERRQVVDRATGRYYCPLDEVLALKGKRHYSPWVQAQAVALATRIPYRQAARLLGGWLGG